MARKLKPPHEVKLINNVPKLVAENFTVEFRMRDQFPVIMQDGACFDVSGNMIEEIPDWVWEQYEKCNDDTKAKLKMTPPKKGWKPEAKKAD